MGIYIDFDNFCVGESVGEKKRGFHDENSIKVG